MRRRSSITSFTSSGPSIFRAAKPGLPDDQNAQILVAAAGVEQPLPHFGIDVGTAHAVDEAHAESERRGLDILYPVTDEPWGIRRFFVRDPAGTVISVLAHLD